jgi:hypothetical protein
VTLAHVLAEEPLAFPVEAGVAEMEVRGGGVRTLKLSVSGPHARGVAVDVSPATIDFGAITANQVVELRPDPTALQAALQRVGNG